MERHLRARRHAVSRHHRQASAGCALAHGQGRARLGARSGVELLPRRLPEGHRQGLGAERRSAAAVDRGVARRFAGARSGARELADAHHRSPQGPQEGKGRGRIRPGLRGDRADHAAADSNAAAPRCAGPEGRSSGFPRRLAQEAGRRGRSGSGAGAGADPNRSRFDAGFSCRDREARRAARARASRRSRSRRSPFPRNAPSSSSSRRHVRVRAVSRAAAPA